MIKVKLLDYHIHRNETTFRYYWVNKEIFKQVVDGNIALA